MSDRHVKVNLTLSDNFSARLGAIAAAAHRLNFEWAMQQATWEPHDWGDFA